MSTAESAGPVPETRLTALHMSFLLLIQAIWGGNLVVSKLALSEVPPFAFTGVRFAILFVVLLPFMRWHPTQFGKIALIGLGSGAGAFGLTFFGVSLAKEVAPLALAMQMGVPFATILSVVVLGERIGPWRTMALVFAFTGIVILAFDPRLTEDVTAMLMVMLGSLAWSVGVIAMRRVKGIGTFDMQGWSALFSFPVLLAAAFLFEPGHVMNFADAGLVGWGGLAYTIVLASLVGHAGIYYIFQRYSVPQTAVFLLLTPILGALFSVILLGDELTWRLLLGGGITFAGVLIITIRESRAKVAVA